MLELDPTRSDSLQKAVVVAKHLGKKLEQ